MNRKHMKALIESAKSQGVTAENVENWLGNDWRFSDVVEILVDIVNGDYTPQNLARDIRETE